MPLPTPGDLPNPGINLPLLHLLHWQVDSLLLSHQGRHVLSDINILNFSDSFSPFTIFLFYDSDGKESACNTGDPGFYIFKLHYYHYYGKWLFANIVRLIILLTFQMFSEFKILKKFL